MLSRTGIYDYTGKNIVPVECGMVPWQCIYFITSFSPKYIFASGKLPTIQEWMEYINSASNKVKWRWLLRNSTPPPVLRGRKGFTRQCGHVIDSSVEFWCSQFANEMAHGFAYARTIAGRTMRCWKNKDSIVRYAIKAFQSTQFVPCMSDKSKRWLLVPRIDLAAIHNNAFNIFVFANTPFNLEEFNSNAVLQRFHLLANKIGEQYGEDIIKSIKRPWHNNGTFFASLKVTIKDHKNSGEVTTRTIAGASKHMFSGLGAWVSSRLEGVLRKYPFLLFDTTSIRSRIRAVTLHPRNAVAKVDIKDFFHSGSHTAIMEDITAMARSWFNETEAYLIIEATYLVISTQFVTSDVTGLTYQAVVGAGMGLTISSCLMDALVIWKCEAQLT